MNVNSHALLDFFPAATQTYPELSKGRIHGKDGSQGK